MSGPTLQLNITAPGQKSVEGSVAAVISLAQALRDLPKASEELLRLQKALQGAGAAPAGLKNSAAGFKELVGEIKNLSAQLGTSFGSLEETIKAGWGKAAKAQAEGAAKAQAEGEAKVRQASGATKGLTFPSVGTAGQPIEVPAAWFAKMQTGSLKIQETIDKAAQNEQAAEERRIQRLKNTSALWATQYQEQQQREAELLAKADEKHRQAAMKKAEAEAAAEELRIQRLKNTSALWATQYQEQQQREAELLAKADEKHRQAAMKKAEAEAAAEELRIQRLKNTSALWATQYQEQQQREAELLAKADEKHRQAAMKKAEAEAAAEELRIQRLKNTSALWATQYQEQQQREAELLAKADEKHRQAAMKKAEAEAAAEEARIQSLKLNSARIEQARREAAEREAAAIDAAIRREDAAYAAANDRRRASRVLGARAQLDAGIPEEQVRTTFGSTAAHAAQLTTLEKAYNAVHGELDRGVPKFKNLSAAMGEAHSAARGLASAFGAIYLTWGSIAPLLAGAALGQSFVQSIKVGANVRQDLETLRVLSDESQSAVAGLERQLVSLGERGPFGPREVAEAMKTLSLAGLNAKEVGQALKPSLDLAVAGGTSINKASEELVAIGTAYGYLPGQFATVSDAITKAAAISMSSVEGMSASFRTASVIAQQYKVSLSDTATGLAILANIGIRGSAAGVALRQMYSELSGATSSTRKEMEKLGIKVIDVNTGAMKPMTEIISQLNAALASKNPEAFQRSIQNLSNERGAKATVALLEAYVTKARDLGQSNAANELERINQAVQNAAGFAAISASQLVATPLNQMKAVVSTFETALLKAFQNIEPTILVVTNRLKEAFNSNQFADLVTGLASAVANATVFLVQHSEQIKLILQGYLAWKGAVIGLGVMNTLTAGVTALSTAIGGAAAAFRGMATAAGLARVATLFLGPISALIGIAATAWTLYEIAGSKAKATEADAAAIRRNLTLKSLDDEIQRLKDVEEQLRKGTDARDADIEAIKRQDLAKKNSEFNTRAQPLRLDIAAARSRVASLEGQGTNGLDFLGQQQMQAELAREKSNLVTLEDQLDKLYTASYESRAQAAQRAAKEAEVMQRTRVVEGLKEPNPRVFGTEGLPPDPAKLALENKELSNLQKVLNDREAAAKAAAQREQELADIKHRGMLLSDAAYSVESERIAKERYDSEIRALSDFLADSAKLMKDLESDPKRGPALAGVRQNVAETARKAALALAAEKEKHDAQLAASQNLQSVQLGQDLDKLQRSVDLQLEQAEAARKYASMLPEEIAAEQAVAAARATGEQALVKIREAYKQAQEESAIYMQSGGEDQATLNRLLANELRLRLLIEEAQKRINVEANKSGEAAKSKYLVDNAPAWQKFVEQGQNSILMLTKYRNQFMDGWVQQGQTIWEEFFKTGKLHMSALKDLFIKTLADLTYQKFVAKPFSELGEGLFDKLVVQKRTGTAANGGINSTEQSLGNLDQTVSGLSDTMSKLGNSFYNLFLEAARGLAVMLQTSGNSSLAGAGSWLSGLLGSGSGDGTVPSPDIAGSAAASARGSWYDGSAYAFGRGGAFVNQPTLFAFGRGGSKLGIMGEAGPEAVMPLAKTSSGRLGVEVAGGGGWGGGFKQSIIVEDHSGGQPAEVRQETGPNGEQLTRIIVGTVAKDFGRGGPTRQAYQKTYRGNQNLPRY